MRIFKLFKRRQRSETKPSPGVDDRLHPGLLSLAVWPVARAEFMSRIEGLRIMSLTDTAEDRDTFGGYLIFIITQLLKQASRLPPGPQRDAAAGAATTAMKASFAERYGEHRIRELFDLFSNLMDAGDAISELSDVGAAAFVASTYCSAEEVKIESELVGDNFDVAPKATPAAVSLTPVESQHLPNEFEHVESQGGPGESKFREAIQFWNSQQFEFAMVAAEAALKAGLAPTFACKAHGLVGEVLLERGELLAAVPRLLDCLSTRPITRSAAWDAACPLAVIYREVGDLSSADALDRVALASQQPGIVYSYEAAERFRALVHAVVG